MIPKKIIQIEIGKSLRFENVASFRKKMKVSNIPKEVEDFIQYLQKDGAQKNGPMVSATFGMEMINGDQVLDMEFLIPIDRKIELPEGYIFKPLFFLVNAIHSRYVGNPLHIESTYNEIINFINNNHLTQITAAYNVEISNDALNHIIDIYIGVNPSVL